MLWSPRVPIPFPAAPLFPFSLILTIKDARPEPPTTWACFMRQAATKQTVDLHHNLLSGQVGGQAIRAGIRQDTLGLALPCQWGLGATTGIGALHRPHPLQLLHIGG